MDNYTLAKTKLERAIKMAENFEEMNESELRSLFLCLLRSIDALPKQNYEKDYIYSKINTLLNMEFKRYGGIFKVTNWKNSVILKKNDVENLVLDVNSLLC